MTNKEVVEQLKLTLDYCMRADPDAYNEIEALQHAIRCMELMPELVEALEEARGYFKDSVSEGHYYWEEEIKKYGKLINKAKELME